MIKLAQTPPPTAGWRQPGVQSEETFENIKHYSEDGIEFWYARELGRVPQYSDRRNFQNAIFKAMESCQNSGNDVADHFGETTNMIKLGKGLPSQELGQPVRISYGFASWNSPISLIESNRVNGVPFVPQFHKGAKDPEKTKNAPGAGPGPLERMCFPC